eukprot:TRINITY_DN492_c1_g1_i1.p1 TRINITY_DN492_c1_g1~~TRINITY_DN492_c1_g1_i1.p1  ORF type:complete len:343 (+),score=102.43 TRINITY_DN492_c1_g1_i1:61-1029(+)
MRVLITGASGLLGRELMESFKDCELVGTGLNRVDGENIIKMDLSNEDEIKSILEEKKPQIIVHAAAIRRPDICDNNEELTEKINVNSTKIIAEHAASHNDCFLIYISTDYVFDGTSPPYKPNDAPNPLNTYGKSKLKGEEVIWESKHSAGVLRVPYLYGKVEYLDESGVTTLLKSLQIEKLLNNSPVDNVSIDNVYQRFPTFNKDVANTVRGLANKRFKHCGLSGTWHFSGKEQMTKYSIVVKLAELLNLPHDHIIPINEIDNNNNNQTAQRPLNSQLDTTALKLMKLCKTTSIDDSFTQILSDLYQKNLIPINIESLNNNE